MRFTLDTNVLVYAVDLDAGDKHELAVELIERAALADGVLTLQCLSEFFAVVTRRGRVAPAKAGEIVERLATVFPVVVATEQCLMRAIRAMRARRLAFWDAMLWAAGREARCRYLLSEDLQDGRTLDGVTFLNPFLPANRAVIEKLMPRA